MNKSIQVKGDLKVEFNQTLLYLKAESDRIRMTFTSLCSLKDFLFFFREHIRETPGFVFFNETGGKEIKFSYYLAHYLIAESGPHIQQTSWLGSYIGIKNLQIHKKNFLRYLLSDFF